MQFSVALPCYNEEENVERTITGILDWFAKDGIDGEVVATNDGSKDKTGEILDRLAQEYPNVIAVHHEVNQGYGNAVRSGLDAATKEWIGYMDSDGQFNPEDFRKLFPYVKESDIVTGRRFKRADPFMRKVNAKGFAFLNVVILGLWIHDINCAMKIFKRSIWSTIRPEYATGALFNAEVFYRAKLHGIKWSQVFVSHYPRLYGSQTGANLSVIMKMFRDMVKLRKVGKKLLKSL